MNDNPDVLRDIMLGYHILAAASAVLGPHGAGIGDGLGALLALAGALRGHHRPAGSLTATSAASAVLSTVLH